MIAVDEVGYVPIAEVGPEYLFQVIADRAGKATVPMTTNLTFSEWTKAIPNTRLCKALIDRITDQAHIIETRPRQLSLQTHRTKRQRPSA